MTETNRVWRLRKRPVGDITDDVLSLEEESVPEPSDGEFLFRLNYLSLDPTNLVWMRDIDLKGVFPQVHRPQDIVVTGALRAVSHVRCRGKGPKLAWKHTEQPAQASGRTTGREPGMCVG